MILFHRDEEGKGDTMTTRRFLGSALFVAEKPPPSHVFEQVALAAAEGSGENF